MYKESKGYINPIQDSSKDTLFTLRSFAFSLCPVTLQFTCAKKMLTLIIKTDYYT